MISDHCILGLESLTWMFNESFSTQCDERVELEKIDTVLLDNSFKEWSSSGKGAVEVILRVLLERKNIFFQFEFKRWITFIVQTYPVYQQDVFDSLACVGVKRQRPGEVQCIKI